MRAFGLASLTNLRANWGDGSEAIRRGEEAIKCARRSGDPGALGYALTATGIAQYVSGQFEEALESFAEALPHWGRSPWTEGFSDDAIWASKAALALGKFFEAQSYLDEAEPHIARHVGQAVLLLNRGRLAYRLGEYAEAAVLFQTADEIFRDNVDRVHAASARVGQAASLAAQGDFHRALLWIQLAEAEAAELIASVDILYDGLGPPDFRRVLLQSLSQQKVSEADGYAHG